MTEIRRLAAIALVLVVVAMVPGCSGSSDAGPATGATEPDEITTTTIAPQSPSTVPTPDGATITQPAQPTAGPGSSALAHEDWRVSEGGEGADAWYVFEPVSPQPAAAPVTVMMHGYFEYEGYDQMYELIRHTVLGGSIVIFPRWQVGVADPCPGPLDIDPCVDAAVAGIRGALDHLTSDPTRVQPEVEFVDFVGFSFGGIITANLANRWQDLDLPEPRVIFLDDPHDGGVDGPGEPALDDDLSGIPSSVLIECHVGEQGVISEDATGGCNAVMPKLDHVAAENKAIVMTRPDDHGQPALNSFHGVCTAAEGKADAYDWNFCWKVWDALRTSATDGTPPVAALADTPEHTSNGEWGDGTPIAPLVVQRDAPIGP